MRFRPGDDVFVQFEGLEHKGHVITASRGNVMASIAIDPEWDYGAVTSRLTPHSIVCVKERYVSFERLGSDPPETP